MQFENYEDPGSGPSDREYAPENPTRTLATMQHCGWLSDGDVGVYILSAYSNTSLDTAEFATILISVRESMSEVGSMHSSKL